MRATRFFAILIFLSLLVSPLFLGARNSAKDSYDPLVRKIAHKHGLEPELIHAIIKAESNYDSFALSVKGAMGLMQLMPETARTYGVHNIYDPEQNIEGGTRYLKDLIRLFNGRTTLVLAAYNAGQEAVKKYNGIPPFQETKNYIRRIQASYGKFDLRTRTNIYKFYDTSGRLVLTNDPLIYNLSRAY